LKTLRPEVLPRLPLDWLIQSMRRDKKRVGNVLHLILLQEIGRAVVVDDVGEAELRTALEYALS
jgi:3-dehydroquinate synthetase